MLIGLMQILHYLKHDIRLPVRALSAAVTNEIQDDWKGKWLEKVFIFFSACLLGALDKIFCTVRFFMLKKMSLYRYAIIMIKLQPAQPRVCIQLLLSFYLPPTPFKDMIWSSLYSQWLAHTPVLHTELLESMQITTHVKWKHDSCYSVGLRKAISLHIKATAELGFSSQKLACNGFWSSVCDQLAVNKRKNWI